MTPTDLSLTKLSSFLVERLRQPLPGAVAHELMRAKASGMLRPKFDHATPPRAGSVLILLYEENGVVKLPLTKRQEYAGAHSGQVSLPGGKAEPGEDEVETALREGEEEIGIKRDDVFVLGRLSTFHVLPSNFLIVPIVAMISTVPVFIPDRHEVARIFSAELGEIMKEDAIKEKEILAAGQYPMIAPHFEIDHEIVWGATAMMLNEFRTILRER